MKSESKFSALFDRILNVAVFISGVLVVLVTVLVVIAVVTRYFGKPIGWVIEISEYSLLYISFLVAAWVLKEKRHVTMDMLINRLSPRASALLNSFNMLAVALISVILTWIATKVTWEFYQTNYTTPSILEFPKYPIFGIIAVGSLALSIEALRESYGYLKKWKAKKEA